VTERRCIGCWQVKDRNELIKVTLDNADKKPKINPDTLTFGRSVYLCYNETCIDKAFRKNKIAKCLKAPVQNELKGQLLDELRNS